MTGPEPAAGFAPPALPAALEPATAFTEAGGDPGFFWDAVRRVMADGASAADPGRALAELVFGLTSLSGILAAHLADAVGAEPGDLLRAVGADHRDHDPA